MDKRKILYKNKNMSVRYIKNEIKNKASQACRVILITLNENMSRSLNVPVVATNNFQTLIIRMVW